LNVHDIKVGSHDREILVLQQVINDNQQNEIEIDDYEVILIIDFSECPPTLQTI